MRWLKKREFITYYLLFRLFKGREVNIGEIIGVLSLFMSRKTAFNIVRRLKHLGLLKRTNKVDYEVIDLQEYLDRIATVYLIQRLIKKARSSGIKVEVEFESNGRVSIRGLPSEVLEAVSKIPFMKLKILKEQNSIKNNH